jgi:hypothetical protein
MSIQLTKPLVVPEYASAIVKMYISDPVTSLTVTLPSHTINVQSVLSSLIPGKTANANAVALNDSDLFIANSAPH